ncbi:MAG: NAD-dependent epimerase/dehydratase family protein, partial [Bacteroidia bacterium]
TEDGSAVDENCWWKNAPDNSQYAISKYNAEREVWRGTEEGLNAIILNPSFIVGPGDPKRSSNVVFPMAAKGINWYTEGITGYVDVRDVAAAVKWALSSTASSQRFVLNAENLSYRQFIAILLNAFGKKPATKLLKPWMTSVGWRAEKLLAALSGRKPRLTKETANVIHQTTRFGGTRIAEQMPLNYHSIQEAVNNAAPFYKLMLNVEL